MKPVIAIKDDYKITDFSKLTNEELVDAFVFPSKELTTDEKKIEEEFWVERRKQFAERTPKQQAFDKTLQLKFQTEA